MAGDVVYIYRNLDSSDTTVDDSYYMGGKYPTIETLGWTKSGYVFKEYNTSRNGTGTAYQSGDTIAAGTVYVIWEEGVSYYIASETELTAVADAIREKTGESGSLTFPVGFANAIGNISGTKIRHWYCDTDLDNVLDIYGSTTDGARLLERKADLDLGTIYYEDDLIVGSMIVVVAGSLYKSFSDFNYVTRFKDSRLARYYILFEVTE